MNILVTGGAGFIGSAVSRYLCGNSNYDVTIVDKLTYAGNSTSLRLIENRPNYRFVRTDICNESRILRVLKEGSIEKVLHLAAESHVDRSIDSPCAFIETNIVGTFRLLNASLTYWRELDDNQRKAFRFHHVSTDEVFGDLPFDSGVFTEDSQYAPSSPYSASKAASDHLVRAWYATYGLPVVLSNCSNNYGPYHFPEKLIPLTILNALEGKPIEVYGKGKNVRDWLFVDDHVRALELVMNHGIVGESYNIGGNSERTNLAVVEAICDILDVKRPLRSGKSHRDLITFVPDRLGHDRRYAIDTSKITRALGWKPLDSFESGLAKTIDWYLANAWWWGPIRQRQCNGNAVELA